MGFTASKEAAFIEAELSFIKAHHQFRFFDTGICQAPMVPHYMTFDEFLEMQFKKDAVYQQYAKLIYADELEVDSLELVIRKRYPGTVFHSTRNEDSMRTLRKMTPAVVYFATNEHMMRGYDYRCSEGIALFIAKQLNSTRARD